MDESGQINVNSSSIIDLKAELYRKQESFKLAKLSKEQNQINDDDNDLYLNRSSNQKYKLGKRIRDNVNLQERRKRENEKPNEEDDQQTIEEEKALKKSREMLELKTKLYEQKCKMKSNGDDDNDDENELINFEQKAIEEKLKLRHLEEQKLQKDEVSDDNGDDDDDDDEWTEFTDSLGRSRRCLKKDLEYLKRIDRETFGLRNNELKTSSSQMFDSYKHNFMNLNRNNELLSDDLKRELDRRDWESDAHKMNEKFNNEQYEHDDDEHAKLGKQHGPTHYQNVQHNEIRDHGVAYYAFDQNEQKRQEQMHLLNSLREQTVNQKQARQKLKEKRKSMMRERLMKIAQRKGIKVNALPSESSSSSEDDQVNTNEDVELAKTTDDGMMQPERPVREPRAKIREWDIGKDQLEKSYQQQRSTPTRFRHEDYIEKRRNERPKEFAPPSTYLIQNSKELKHDLKYNKKTKNKDQNKTIEKVKVNFETSLNDNKSWYIDKGKQINFQSNSSERPNHNQSQTSTPSTSSTSSYSIDCKFDVQNQITNLLHHYKRNT